MSGNPTREEIKAVAEEIRPSIERVAEHKGWVLNENKDIADSVIEGLARNKILHGKRYCPCRILSADEENDRQYLCPCKGSAEDVENVGHCHCYLYFKK